MGRFFGLLYGGLFGLFCGIPSATASQYGALFRTILRGRFFGYGFYRLFSSVAVSQYGALFWANIKSW